MTTKTSNPAEYQEAEKAKSFYSDAVKACMDGSKSKLEKLFETYVDQNPQHNQRIVIENFQSEGRTLLHIAAASGHSHIMKYLLEFIPKKLELINMKDHLGFTPLINATISESSEIMTALIEHGADVNIKNNSGTVAAHFAAGDGSVDRLTILHEAGASFNFISLAGSPLHWAAGKQKNDAIRFLISHGADLNLLNSDQVTAIYMAAATGSDITVCTLLTAGASINNIKMKDNVTLLHICAENGHINAVDIMLSNAEGRALALSHTTDGNNNLPIHYAAMSRNTDIITKLLPHSGIEFSSMSMENILKLGEERLQQWQIRAASTSSISTNNIHNKGNTQSLQPSPVIEEPEAIAPAVNEEAIKLAEEYKNIGNSFYLKKQFKEALEQYSLAIQSQGDNHIYWSNRSACFLSAGDAHRALRDAEVCRRISPTWSKGCYRLASARFALGLFEDAAVAAFEGCKLDDENEDLKKILRKSVEKGKEEHLKKSKVGI
eukprot:gene5140-10275_t